MSSVQVRTEWLNGERPERVETLQLGVGVAVEVPLAIETAPTGRLLPLPIAKKKARSRRLPLRERGPYPGHLCHDDVKTHTKRLIMPTNNGLTKRYSEGGWNRPRTGLRTHSWTSCW